MSTFLTLCNVDALSVRRVLAEVWTDCLFVDAARKPTSTAIRHAVDALSGGTAVSMTRLLPHVVDTMSVALSAEFETGQLTLPSGRYTLEHDAALAAQLPVPHAADVNHAEKEEDKRMLRVVDLLREYAPYAEPFLAPVKLDVAADYYDVITHPMDLGTLRTRVEAGVYRGAWSLFKKDLQLIYDNCRKYNHAEGNEYAAMATKMEIRTRYLLDALAAASSRQEARIAEANAFVAAAAAATKAAVDSADEATKVTAGAAFVAESTRCHQYGKLTSEQRLSRIQANRSAAEHHISLQALPARSRSAMRAATHRRAYDSAYFPELEPLNATLPPATAFHDAQFHRADSDDAVTYRCGTFQTNPLLQNIENVQKIRRIHRRVAAASSGTRLHDGGLGGTGDASSVAEWPVLGNPALWLDPAPRSTLKVGIDAATAAVARGCGVLSLHAGFEDCESTAMAILADAATCFLDTLCECARRVYDDGDQHTVYDAISIAIESSITNGSGGIAQYWRDDVVGFGSQLRQVEKHVESKFSSLVRIELAASSGLKDSDAALVSGNFGVEDLGLNILSLQELQVSTREELPSSFLSALSLNPSCSGGGGVKRHRKSTIGSVDSGRQRWAYPTPEDWPPIIPNDQIGLLREPIKTAVDAATTAAARARGRSRGRGGGGRARSRTKSDSGSGGAALGVTTQHSLPLGV